MRHVTSIVLALLLNLSIVLGADGFNPKIVYPASGTTVTATGNRDLFVAFSFEGAVNPDGVFDVHFGIDHLESNYSYGMFDGPVSFNQPYAYGRIPTDAPPGHYVVIAGIADGYGGVPYVQVLSEIFQVVAPPKIDSVSPYPVGIGQTVTIYGSGFTDFNQVWITDADNPGIYRGIRDLRASQNGTTLSFIFPDQVIDGSGSEKGGNNGKWVGTRSDAVYSIEVSTDVGGQTRKFVSTTSPEIQVFDYLNYKDQQSGTQVSFHFDASGVEKGQVILHQIINHPGWYEFGAEWNLGSVWLEQNNYWSGNLPSQLFTGSYEIEIRGELGVSGWSTVFWIDVPLPKLTALVSGGIANQGEYIIIKCLTSGGNSTYSYNWEVEGMDTWKGGDESIGGVFISSGIKTISVTVNSGDGQTVKTTCQFYVFPGGKGIKASEGTTSVVVTDSAKKPEVAVDDAIGWQTIIGLKTDRPGIHSVIFVDTDVADPRLVQKYLKLNQPKKTK